MGPAKPSEKAKEPDQPLQSPPGRTVAAGFRVADRPGVETSPRRHLLLGQPQPEPGGPDPPRQVVPFRDEPRAEDPLDGRPAPGQGVALAPLPRCNRLRPAAQPRGEGSLRQPEVHPALADSLPKGKRQVGITPWEYTRSASRQPQAGKRQRNGASAAGSGTPSAAANVRRRTLHNITRA